MDCLKELRVDSLAHLGSKRAAVWWQGIRREADACDELGDLDAVLWFFESRERPPSFFRQRDAFLRALLVVHRESSSRVFSQALLLSLYWRLLPKAIARVSVGLPVDREDIASQTVCTFLELLDSISLSRNRDIHTALVRRLPEKVLDWAMRDARRDQPANCFEPSTESSTLDSELPSVRRTGWELDAAALALAELEARSAIRPESFAMLMETIVEQRPLTELISSPRNGGPPMSYEACKKRLQRSRASIRDYLVANDLSLAELALARLEKNSTLFVPREGVGQREEETKGTDHENNNKRKCA